MTFFIIHLYIFIQEFIINLDGIIEKKSISDNIKLSNVYIMKIKNHQVYQNVKR